jgi:D-serine dehydratase
VRSTLPLSLEDVVGAERTLERLAAPLLRLFPELTSSQGIIESPLYSAAGLQRALMSDAHASGRWFIKADHALPIAGSIKARGGFYEVLLHAEDIAQKAGLFTENADRELIVSPAARALFAQHEISVGSTGNLGLSIGVMAAALGFKAVVHMSADAKAWKKTRLRANGVQVVEHEGDYGAAVAAGRQLAQRSPNAYFVDDENSQYLFLGYSVAALRLRRQLEEANITLDAAHPLFVYLPCGVGGAPGGITFGLRMLMGDHVHCFFAEPVAAPCMLLRLAAGEGGPISVKEVGLDGRTEADGLAVGQASEWVARTVGPLVSGVFTVRDEELFRDLYLLDETESLRIEPSAAAGFGGPRWILGSPQGRRYLAGHGLDDKMDSATHVLWTTGGSLVPGGEYERFRERGKRQVI